VNSLCDNALLAAYAAESLSVSQRLIEEAAEDLGLHRIPEGVGLRQPQGVRIAEASATAGRRGGIAGIDGHPRGLGSSSASLRPQGRLFAAP
jgi:hypothetical protein